MPSKINDMKRWCRIIDGRSSPDCSMHESDDESHCFTDIDDDKEAIFCSANAKLKTK